MKIGIDIGGTQIRVGKVINNKIEEIKVFNNDVNDSQTSINRIFDIINEFNDKRDLEFIGLACPGPLNIKNGVILNTPNLKSWNNLKIVDIFKNKFNVEVKLNNDANTAALGQFMIRKNIDSLLFFTISTGIGAGFVKDGIIFSGSKGLALEVANALPTLNSENDDDKLTGIEYLASGINIPKQLNKLGVNVLDSKEAFKLYYLKENGIVNEYFKKIENKLVEFFTTAIYFFNPDVLVTGGSVSLHNKEFFKKIFQRVKVCVNTMGFDFTHEFAIDVDSSTIIGCSNL